MCSFSLFLENTITSWHYDISLEENMTNLHVTFQHPLLSSSTAFGMYLFCVFFIQMLIFTTLSNILNLF